MNIVIFDDYQDAVRKLACFKKLASFNTKIYTNNAKGNSQLIFRLKDSEILILNHGRTTIAAPVLEKLPKLKLIIQVGRLGTHLDVEACAHLNIAVIELGESAPAAAEFTWALIMSAMRRLPYYVSTLKHGGWQQSGLKRASMPDNFALGTTLAGKTLGIWGFGAVGAQVAQYGKTFGMNVVIWDSQASLSKATEAGYQVARSKKELFQHSDVLSIHLRLSEENQQIIQLDDLSLMKATALFVNTSHAQLVDTQALVCALNRGTPGLAAIDVFDTEPILQGHALLRLENTICTPHIANVDQETLEAHYGAAFDRILHFAEGSPALF